MKRLVSKTLIGVSLLSLCACDDGRIYPETNTSADGKTVVLEGVLEGFDSWSSNYRVSIAGFEQADDEYASVSKVITASDIQDGKALVELSGIKDNVTLVRLCVLDRLRRHIVGFKEVDISDATEPVKMDVGTIDISMFNAIQQSFFNTTCANCHGASNRAAAGLFLTEGTLGYTALQVFAEQYTLVRENRTYGVGGLCTTIYPIQSTLEIENNGCGVGVGVE